jgi:hypothetical protein
MSPPERVTLGGRHDAYELFGLPVVLHSGSHRLLDAVGETFDHFRRHGHAGTPEITLGAVETGGVYQVDDGCGRITVPDEVAALSLLLDRLNQIVLDRLSELGVLAIHAASLVSGKEALIIAGPSGSGKSTLALGLTCAGMWLLSDELALLDRDDRTILPYRRGVHLRAGTPELVPQLAGLLDRPQCVMNGGIRWAIAPERLQVALPNCLGEAAPLGRVLLLDPRSTDDLPSLAPLSHGAAVIELLRGTPSAAADLMPTLRRLAVSLHGVTCARLAPGDFRQTLDLIHAWTQDDDPQH